jgi:hypothetical protein
LTPAGTGTASDVADDGVPVAVVPTTDGAEPPADGGTVVVVVVVDVVDVEVLGDVVLVGGRIEVVLGGVVVVVVVEVDVLVIAVVVAPVPLRARICVAPSTPIPLAELRTVRAYVPGATGPEVSQET